MTHTCHARDCSVKVPPAMFMCKRHWRMLTDKLRAKIWTHYVPGQEVRKDPSDKYLKWAGRAIDYVAMIEGKKKRK